MALPTIVIWSGFHSYNTWVTSSVMDAAAPPAQVTTFEAIFSASGSKSKASVIFPNPMATVAHTISTFLALALPHSLSLDITLMVLQMAYFTPWLMKYAQTADPTTSILFGAVKKYSLGKTQYRVLDVLGALYIYTYAHLARILVMRVFVHTARYFFTPFDSQVFSQNYAYDDVSMALLHIRRTRKIVVHAERFGWRNTCFTL